MSESLQFERVYSYDLSLSGISVPLLLSWGDETEEITAKVDTGASYCIFRRLHGSALGIDVESGMGVEIGTVTGSFTAYGHELRLTCLGITMISTVYFAESVFFDRNVLGRIGWLDRVKLGLIDSESLLYLSPYS